MFSPPSAYLGGFQNFHNIQHGGYHGGFQNFQNIQVSPGPYQQLLLEELAIMRKRKIAKRGTRKIGNYGKKRSRRSRSRCKKISSFTSHHTTISRVARWLRFLSAKNIFEKNTFGCRTLIYLKLCSFFLDFNFLCKVKIVVLIYEI